MKTFKQIFFSVLFLVLFSNAGWGQLLTEEVDGLTLGNLGTQSSWVQNGTGTDVQVANTTPVIYAGYNGGDDEYLTISTVNGIDPHKVFTSQTASTSIWFSFIINVSSFSGTGEYFMTLRNTANTTYFARLFARNSSGSLQFGTSKGSATATNYSGTYSYGTTYLVVARYDWSTATSSNDNFYVWINPDISSEPGTGTATYSIEGGTDPSFGSAINSIMLHQRSATNTPSASIEGIRVSANSNVTTGWEQLDCHAKTFYSKSTGNLNLTSNWGHKNNGKGSHCPNFTENLKTYNIRNSATHTIGANWTVSGTNSKVVLGDGTNACTFTVPSTNSFSGTIDVSNNGTLKLQNTTLPTLGTLNSGSTVEYNQSSSVNLAAATYNNLTINNSSGTTLSGAINVNGTLSLTNGLLNIGANNLTLGSGANISGTPTASNMIVATSTGELRKVFTATGSFTFPVGDETGIAEYSPVTVNITAGNFAGGAYAGVNLRNEKHPNNGSVLNYINRYWTLTSSGITSFFCSPTFTFLDADVGGTEGNKASLFTGQYNSGWTLRNQASGNNLSATDIQSFSDFSGGDQGALPVNLQSFSSVVSGNYVKLNWITAMEENNSGFDVERAEVKVQSTGYSKIGFIEGNGTKNSSTEYSFEDKNLQSGKYKYRLKQIDYNGNYEYFELNGEVEVGVPKKFDMSQNYPNPFNPVTKINFDLPENGLVNIRLYDMLGREVAVLVNEVRNAGYHTVQFDASKLSSGVYFYKMSAGKFNGVKKMSVIK